MKKPLVRVLMLGEKIMAPSVLLGRPVRKACNCWFAASADEGIELFRQHDFQVVLNAGPVRQAMRMLPALSGSTCSVFSAFPVERGSWWLPLMHLGKECIGAPGMRTAEFLKVLDDLLAKLCDRELIAIGNSYERSHLIRSIENLAS